MGTNAVRLAVDGERLIHDLEKACTMLDNAHGEVVLDLSSVRRVDPASLRAMEHLADTADGKGTKLILNNVNIDVYKVLKLMKLAPRFSIRT
jgi:anti-anti-sigma regulatory factor